MLPDDEQRFATELALLRKRHGLSQSELARKMVDAGWSNYSQMTVSRTEKGERPIRLAEARSLAGILGATVDEMIAPERTPLGTVLAAIDDALDAREAHQRAQSDLTRSRAVAEDRSRAYRRALVSVLDQLTRAAPTLSPDERTRVIARVNDLEDAAEWAEIRAAITV